MQVPSRSAFLPLLVALLAHVPALLAQERSVVSAGIRPSLALIDNQADATLHSMGFQISAYLSRPFASDFAALVELGVTTIGHRAFYPPCAFPGCSASSSLGVGTAISLAPGLQWYTTAGARRAAFTLTPGVLWLVSRPSGTKGIVPKVGGRFELGWLLNGGPRVGVSLGVEWWGSTGILPRWILPLGVTLGLR